MSDPTLPDDEALDAALGERLRAAAPPVPDADAVLTDLRPRLVRARRRHQAFVAGAAALGVVALVVVGVVALGPGGGSDLRTPPATRPRPPTTAPTTVPTLSPTTPPSVEVPGSTGPGATTPTSLDDHGGDDDSSGSGSGRSDDSSGSGSGSGSDDSAFKDSGSGSDDG